IPNSHRRPWNRQLVRGGSDIRNPWAFPCPHTRPGRSIPDPQWCDGTQTGFPHRLLVCRPAPRCGGGRCRRRGARHRFGLDGGSVRLRRVHSPGMVGREQHEGSPWHGDRADGRAHPHRHGASGAQVFEGWYGQPYRKPLARTREYISIIRDVLRREAPVTAPGPAYPLPYGDGQGKPLLSTVHPLRADLPIHLAAQGPKNTELAAEIADGWLPAFFSPRHDADYRERLQAGFARRSEEISPAAGFEVSASVPVAIGTDIEDAATHLKPHVALYVGGMGSATDNFHRNAIARLGWEEECEEIAERYRADKRAAAEAVPTELVLD